MLKLILFRPEASSLAVIIAIARVFSAGVLIPVSGKLRLFMSISITLHEGFIAFYLLMLPTIQQNTYFMQISTYFMHRSIYSSFT